MTRKKARKQRWSSAAHRDLQQALAKATAPDDVKTVRVWRVSGGGFYALDQRR